MSKISKSDKKTEGKEPEVVKSDDDYIRPLVVVMLGFVWLASINVVLAACLFFSSFMVPNPEIPGTLRLLAVFGTISTFGAVRLHYLIKIYRASSTD